MKDSGVKKPRRYGPTGLFTFRESAAKPGSVVDSHSSRPAITHWLQQPTRSQRGPRQREPIWSCFGWSLPCHELLPVARCALTAPFHPYLICLRSHRRFALCCTGRRLAPPRRYLAPCPVKPGLSSPTCVAATVLANSGAQTISVLPESKPRLSFICNHLFCQDFP
jgi:hypothetical protein